MNILLVGAGRMGGALLGGWKQTYASQAQIVVLDPNQNAKSPCDGFTPVANASDVPNDFEPDLIVLATKPQLIEKSVSELEHCIGLGTVRVSIAAGVATQTIAARMRSKAPIVRAMPNIGATVGHSVTAAYPSLGTTAKQKELVHELFLAVGKVYWLSAEDDLHLVTAISGSGPAYYFAFCEAMIATAIKEGLDSDLARQLAIGTVTCAGQLLSATPDPEALREAVTSPSGTTAAGIHALTGDGTFAELVELAIRAAKKRSREMS